MALTQASSLLKPALLAPRSHSGTGFSRESVGNHTAELMALTQASSWLKPVLLAPRSHSGTGFSRESVGSHTAELMALTQASSRLKPVPLIDRVLIVGLASAGKASAATPQN